MTHLFLLAVTALSSAGAAHVRAQVPCDMTPAEQAWVTRSLAAWNLVRTQKLRLSVESHPRMVLFDDRCRFEATAGASPQWRGTPHQGTITLPDGNSVPAAVISSTSRNDSTGEVFFVMALPPIWVASKAVGMRDEDGLTAVFVHEFSHVEQLPILQPLFDSASKHFKVPEHLSDDRLQQVFEHDSAYAAAYTRERDLLFAAATEPDSAKARTLAREAYASMVARQRRWFVGDSAVWKPYDDLFLTMEGIGQWDAYAWLADPRGGGLTTAAARDKMRGRRRWWSQDEGLALFLVIDRFLPSWAQQAFGRDPVLGIDLLGEAVSGRS